MSILFLGKYDESMHSLEEKILNIQDSSASNANRKHIPKDLNYPDVIKYPIRNCDIWVISGDVKPTLLMKELISKTTVVLFIFNFDNLETLQFLTEGWGPIIQKIGKSNPEKQKRILFGTNFRSSKYTKEARNIEETMKFLNCQKYFGEESELNLNEIGDYKICSNLIQYISDQISKQPPKLPINNENSEESIEDEYNNKDESKIEFKTNNFIFNLFLTKKKAEIVNMQNANGEFVVPTSIPYEGEQYEIIKICDHAFQSSRIASLSFCDDSQLERIGDYVFEGSTIQTLFIPSKLKKLGKYWCAGADKLLQIILDQPNPYFSIKNNFFFYEKDSVSEVLFPLRYFYGTLCANFSIGSYAFYKRSGVQSLISEKGSQVIDIGDYSFFGAPNLQSIKFYEAEINIGEYSFSTAAMLKTIEINNKSAISIGKESFSNNNRLQTVSLTGNSIHIGDNCFYKSFDIYSTYHRSHSTNSVTIKSESKLEIGNNCFDESKLQIIEIIGKEILIKKESFNKCKNLISFIVSRSAIIFFEENAFNECSYISEFDIKFGDTFDASSYYEQISILKKGKKNNLLLLKKKGTEEKYVAKQFLEREKYDTYRRNFSNHLHLTSKDKNSNLSTFCGCGYLKFESEPESYLTIITKYFDNGSLEDVINNKTKLTNSQKYNILLGITYEMRFLHSNKYNYPNLSPKKILLDENYYPHLNIFGYSHKSEPTIYTAPEKKKVHKSDVYSFSLIIYQLITGNKLNEKTIERPNTNIIKDESIKNLIERCYSYNENSRPSFQEILKEITNVQFIESFEAKEEEEIYQYMKLLRIQEVAVNVEINGIIYNISKYNKAAKIINITSENTNFIFQEFITYNTKSYKITEIQKEIFSNPQIKSFSIIEKSKNLTIGDFPFESSDQNLTIPTNIFKNFYYLTNIKIECSKSLTISRLCFYTSRINSFEATSDQIEIGDECFSSRLQKLKIKCAKLSIGKSCFINCNSLSEISLEGLEQIKIDTSTFNGCKSLNKIFISAQCLEVVDLNFINENQLQSIELNYKKKLITCQTSFSNCYSLSTLLIKNEGEEELTISKNTFNNCISLTSITIDSKSTINIEKETFSENSNLQTVSLNGNKIQLGDKCFYKSFDNSKKNSVRIASNTSIEIGQQCFSESNIIAIDIKSTEVHTKEESFLKSTLNKFSVSDTTEVFINDFSFKDCSNLISISLNEIGYLKIGSNAFYGCKKLENIKFKFLKPFASSKYYQAGKIIKKIPEYTIRPFMKNGTSEQYIVKVLKDNKKHIEYLYLFINQMIALSRDTNPFMSNSFECGNFIFNKHPFLTVVCKKYANGSLEDVMKDKLISSEQKYLILLGITACIKYLDSKKICHPDLTPQTIMLDESYHPHFNISDLVDISEPTIYTAPEIIKKRPKNDKSDVYSFSIIAYELITGQQPDPANLSNKILNNKQITDFLNLCMSQYSSKRPSFSEIFDEFMKNQYSEYFKANKETIYEYLSLIGEFPFNEFLINLNEYTIISKIGSGTFSEVFTIKNKNEKTELMYAAKISKEALDEDNKSILRNLQREINIISKMNHPTILKFIGFSPTNFSNEDKPVIVTEFMRNGTLADIIKLERSSQSPRGWDDTKKLISIYGIAYGMSYLHSHKIIHRDLKPSNILMDEFLIPKISDFGLSKFIETTGDENSMSNSSTNGIKGTPLYTAPEICEGNEYSPSSDVYSFGLILYELITNKEPFYNIAPGQIPFKVMKGNRPEFPFRIPETYQNLIERCWSQEPTERPTFDQIIKQMDHDQGFITAFVNFDDYHDFIDYLEECESTFDTNKPFIPINAFVKRDTKTFSPINIHEQKQIEINGIIYNICKNKTTKIRRGCEMNDRFKFPDCIYYNDEIYDIVEICDEAFSKSFSRSTVITRLIKITIPDEVEKIGKRCFERLEIIKEVIFLSTNLTIGEGCFYECKSLTSISFPYAQNLIFSSQCFKRCEKLREISISRAQKIEIGESCFSNLKQIPSISFECQDLKVRSKCFDSCDSLKSFSCVVSKIVFGLQPFNKCSNLEEFLIKYKPISTNESSNKNQNEEINFNDNFFYDCSSLKYIEVDTAQPITISTNAFNANNLITVIKLKSLSTITLSNKDLNTMKVQELEVKGKQVNFGDNCFYSSNELKRLTIESENLYIGKYCFNNCCNLKSISFPKAQNLVFGIQCFKECEKLQEISISKAQKIEIEESCFSNLKQIPSISFECQDLKVRSKCFDSCDSLKSFSCVVSKIAFGLQPFNKCSKLEKVIIKYKPISTNESSNKNQNEEINFNDNFFYDCSSLKYIEVDTAQPITISTNAFDAYNHITVIKLKSLSTITLSNKNLNTIRVQELEVKGKQVNFGDKCFNSSNELKRLTIESENLYIGKYCFNNCCNLKSFSVDKSTKIKLGSSAFCGCLKLEDFSFNSYYGHTIEELEIGDYCFSGCSCLKKASLDKSTKIKLGSHAFSDCIKLEYFNISSYNGPVIREIEIGDSCFSNCKILPSIYFGKVQNARIGSHAFEKCVKITRFSMSVSSKLEIGDYCFSESSNLIDVYLVGEDLIAGAYLFSNCSLITSITLRGTKNKNINHNACYGISRKLINY